MARRAEALEEIRDALGREHVEVLAGDATSIDAQREAVERLVERFGQLDAAFANAGVGIDTPGTEDGDPQEWKRVVDLNVLGVLWTAKVTLPQLRKTKGHFVVTGSVAGRTAGRGSIYSASKWFVHGFGQNLANEMQGWGGRCTIIAPGMVDTPFFDQPKPDKLAAEDIADSVMFALQAPPRANVRELLIVPTT